MYILFNLLIFFLHGFTDKFLVQAREVPHNFFSPNPNVTYPKISYYDGSGTLRLNGSFVGNSTAIVLDFKEYRPTCTTNTHFSFTYVPKPYKLNTLDIHPCNQGMTVCYESQLDSNNVFPMYRVRNKPNNFVAKACQDLNNGNVRAHGFNVGLLAQFSGAEDGYEKKLFYVLTTSFENASYYFYYPSKNGIFTLQLGSAKNLMTRIIDSDGKDVKLLEKEQLDLSHTHIERKELYEHRTNFGEPPTTDYDDYAGLWLLYLDWKRGYNQMQIIQVIHQGKCNLETIVRGNKMQRCRAYMEDLAVTEPVNTTLTFTFTDQVGVIQREEYGQENLSELKQKVAKSILENKLQKWTNERLNKNASSTSKGDSHQTFNGTTNDKSIEAYIDLTDGSGISGGITPKYTKEWKDAEKFGHNKGGDETKKKGMFGEVTKSSSLMEAFGKTQGLTESLTHSQMMSSSTAFSKIESVDVEVTLPPNKRLMLRQMMFECDGNVVRMPIRVLTDGHEELNLTENKMGQPQTLSMDDKLHPNMTELNEKLKKLEKEIQAEMERQKQEEAKNKTTNGNLSPKKIRKRSVETLKSIMLNGENPHVMGGNKYESVWNKKEFYFGIK